MTLIGTIAVIFLYLLLSYGVASVMAEFIDPYNHRDPSYRRRETVKMFLFWPGYLVYAVVIILYEVWWKGE